MHQIIMSILLNVIQDNDSFTDYQQFLVDFPEEQLVDIEQKHLCMGYHMKDGLLKYS